MDERYRIVLFNIYCPTCKHKELDEHKEPCDSCVSRPVNLYSHKPVNWEAK